ncbi:unnamed protein product [Clonostachys rhizophaga]|uniref:Uncharacterized protein n=1 Tax=Clonostachys rhizophaga TaxID=160324 RepID=A0A9N9VL60_9HYPO|nr:unnamed protein product [Clonostachys rhizophaga]
MHFTKTIFSLFAFSALAASELFERELYERELSGEDPAMIVRELREDYLEARDTFMEARDLFLRAPSLGTCRSAGKHTTALQCRVSTDNCGPCKAGQKVGDGCFCRADYQRNQGGKLPSVKSVVGKKTKQ